MNTLGSENRMQGWTALPVFLVLVMAAASSGGFFQPGPWYDLINKPWWTPPDWVFPVAWTILYTMIAIAGWLVWRKAGFNTAIAVWGVGLVLNALWSYFMFGRQDIASAMIDVTGLWLATGAFVFLAWPVSRPAALLFTVYWGWVTFAAALNFAVLRLNS